MIIVTLPLSWAASNTAPAAAPGAGRRWAGAVRGGWGRVVWARTVDVAQVVELEERVVVLRQCQGREGQGQRRDPHGGAGL